MGEQPEDRAKGNAGLEDDFEDAEKGGTPLETNTRGRSPQEAELEAGNE